VNSGIRIGNDVVFIWAFNIFFMHSYVTIADDEIE
jgi:hypothetical protein